MSGAGAAIKLPGKTRKSFAPELKKYMGKRLTVKINGNRAVTGRLSGFDDYMNIVLEETTEETTTTDKPELGIVVSEGLIFIAWQVATSGMRNKRALKTVHRCAPQPGRDLATSTPSPQQTSRPRVPLVPHIRR